jgi:phospholipase C
MHCSRRRWFEIPRFVELFNFFHLGYDMFRSALRVTLLVLIVANAAYAGTTFNHIVIVVQENRTPDNIFGSNPTFEPGVDIATYGVGPKGTKIRLTPVTLVSCYDLHHSHAAFEAMYDNGKMDGAAKVPVRLAPGGCTVPPQPQYKYLDNSTGTMQPYFQIAMQYGFANRMFQTNQGPSFPAHQFIFGGTSAPSETSVLFAAENMTIKAPTGLAGCIGPPDQRVVVIDPFGSETSNPSVFPCFERPTLSDELLAASDTWRYYTPGAGSIWSAPDAIDHICVAQAGPTGAKTCTGTEWNNSVVVQPSQVLTDISNCNLAAVTWVIPEGTNSDHAIANTGGGPAWVSSIVNAIGNQAQCPGGETFWNDTAILITWDDWGGWYDHVPPPSIGQPNGWGTGYVYGFRVPLLVVSAYTPAGYVDNGVHDFGSILRLVETNFGLGLIGPGTYADAYADDLAPFFPLSTPRTFDPIPLPAGVAAAMRRAPLVHTPPDEDEGDE